MTEDRLVRLISRGIDGVVALEVDPDILVRRIDVLIVFAGKETAANLALSLIVNLQADRWIAYRWVPAVDLFEDDALRTARRFIG